MIAAEPGGVHPISFRLFVWSPSRDASRKAEPAVLPLWGPRSRAPPERQRKCARRGPVSCADCFAGLFGDAPARCVARRDARRNHARHATDPYIDATFESERSRHSPDRALRSRPATKVVLRRGQDDASASRGRNTRSGAAFSRRSRAGGPPARRTAGSALGAFPGRRSGSGGAVPAPLQRSSTCWSMLAVDLRM